MGTFQVISNESVIPYVALKAWLGNPISAPNFHFVQVRDMNVLSNSHRHRCEDTQAIVQVWTWASLVYVSL